MGYKKISFKEFIIEIDGRGGPAKPKKSIPTAWLIGAGMSVSSGIPLAQGVCERMAVFEYLANETQTKPWDTEDSGPLEKTQHDFRAFFNWWDEQDESELKEGIDDAFQYLRNTHEELADLKKDSAEFYQKLFPIFSLSRKDQTVFLSALISSAQGGNLASLGLAGIIRDHPRWGNTLFTTNFDDLLLQAFLSVNHNARIFDKYDDLKNLKAKPRLPQIVYLHGVHTNYFIDNNELTSYSAEKRANMTARLKESNLIVLGYSGWEDIAFAAMKEFQDPRAEPEGSIFWVPYRNEGTIPAPIQQFLNDFPPGRVYVVENPPSETPLDADSFVMSLCQYLNPLDGGIAAYRNEFLNQARRKHDFILNQLDDYPEFDPKTGLSLLNQARDYHKNGEHTDADLAREKAKSLIREDLPGPLKAELWQELGLFDLLRRDYELAEENLLRAFDEWQSPIATEREKAQQHVFTVRLGLAECKLRTGNYYQAKDHLFRAQHLINKEVITEADKAGQVALLFAALALYEGNGGAMKPNLDAFVKKTEGLEENDHPRLFAHYNFLVGLESYHYTLRISKAKWHFSAALSLYEAAGQLAEKANCLKYLADIQVRNNEFATAWENLDQCLELYEASRDEMGVANVYSAIGDLHFQRAVLGDQTTRRQASVSALVAYNQAAVVCREHDLDYNLINCLADILVLFREVVLTEDWGQEEALKEEYDKTQEEMKSLLEEKEIKNAYGSAKLGRVNVEQTPEELEQLIGEEE